MTDAASPVRGADHFSQNCFRGRQVNPRSHRERKDLAAVTVRQLFLSSAGRC